MYLYLFFLNFVCRLSLAHSLSLSLSLSFSLSLSLYVFLLILFVASRSLHKYINAYIYIWVLGHSASPIKKHMRFFDGYNSLLLCRSLPSCRSILLPACSSSVCLCLSVLLPLFLLLSEGLILLYFSIRF